MVNKKLSKQKVDGKRSAFSVFPTFEIEKKYLCQGYELIAGVDEAGRGSLAGPLALGLVIYDRSLILNPPKDIIDHVNDSKKITRRKREELCEVIKKYALFTAVQMVPHTIIDKININRATEFALNRLLESIYYRPDCVLMDGNYSFNIPVPYISIVRGDSTSISIASASILAKVRRDAVMDKFERIYPGYDLTNNKGYGTKKHKEAIRTRGFCSIHRKSYEPVKSMHNKREGCR